MAAAIVTNGSIMRGEGCSARLFVFARTDGAIDELHLLMTIRSVSRKFPDAFRQTSVLGNFA